MTVPGGPDHELPTAEASDRARDADAPAARACEECGRRQAHRKMRRGLCMACYSRFLRRQSGSLRVSAEVRFWAQVDKTQTCWLWTGSGTPTGYGQIGVNGRKQYVHRYAYELLVGPIPEGLTIDHLCRNPPCVNPSHMEPVTQAENTRRGVPTKADCDVCGRRVGSSVLGRHRATHFAEKKPPKPSVRRRVICSSCSQEGPHQARGLCTVCYLRAYRRGELGLGEAS